jgi:hypothetical protein
MYRLVFISIDPRTRLMKKECGPWQVEKSACERWMTYFKNVGHQRQMIIEASKDAEATEKSDFGGMVV